MEILNYKALKMMFVNVIFFIFVSYFLRISKLFKHNEETKKSLTKDPQVFHLKRLLFGVDVSGKEFLRFCEKPTKEPN